MSSLSGLDQNTPARECSALVIESYTVAPRFAGPTIVNQEVLAELREADSVSSLASAAQPRRD